MIDETRLLPSQDGRRHFHTPGLRPDQDRQIGRVLGMQPVSVVLEGDRGALKKA
jgi:hypothetical protein